MHGGFAWWAEVIALTWPLLIGLIAGVTLNILAWLLTGKPLFRRRPAKPLLMLLLAVALAEAGWLITLYANLSYG